MTLLLALRLLAWCVALAAIVVACLAVPLELMGQHVPFRVLVRLSAWGGSGLLFVLWLAKVAS